MTTNMSCGQAMLALLEAYGCEVVFGMPGVHTLELYRGFAGTRLRHVLFRHEQGGGFMADGYARVSGRPGVCLLITGPGVTNAATPIGQAWSDSSPVLVLASVNAAGDLGAGRGRLHEITDQRAVMAPLTALARTVTTPAQAPGAMAAVFARFASARPRPCHVEVPIDVLELPAGFRIEAAPLPGRPLPSAESVEEAARLCEGMRRPVLVAGGGTVDAAAEVTLVAERLGAAVLLTTAAKGVLAPGHALNAGTLLSSAAGQRLLESADLVVAVGTELSETDSWVERLPIAAPLLRIDIDVDTLGRDYTPAVSLLGDAAASLRLLAEALPAKAQSEFRDGREVAAARAAAMSEWSADAKVARHLRVLELVREATPAEGFFATDMTQLAYTANAALDCELPRSYLHPIGYGTLGFALPAAIGAAIAAPRRPAVVMAGDAGFLFTVQELATAVDERLPMAIVLWNNDALGQIRDGMIERGIPEIGVLPRRNPDYPALARAFGARAATPASAAEFKGAIGEAFAADAPTLIEVREDADWLA